MNKLLLTLVVLLGIGLSSKIQAAVVYSQATPDEPIGAFSSQDELGGQKIANSFVISGDAPVMIKSLRFIGGYGVTSPPPLTPPLDSLPPDMFRITFLEDAAGNPGAPLTNGDFMAAQVAFRSPTGGSLLNGFGNPIEYGVNLGDGIVLNPSTTYWLSATNNVDNDFFWVWARANGLSSSQVASTFSVIENGPWQVEPGGGMWFELNDHVIPEPSSLTMLALTTMCLAIRRFRQC